MVTTKSSIFLFFAFATAFRLSITGALISIFPAASGPTAIFSIYISGACNRFPCSATAIVVSAFHVPAATMLVPSNGSTAISISGPSPVPNFSPIYNIGASSISPSPMTTVPDIWMLLNIFLIAEVAAPSASSLFPFPVHLPAARAAASVTLTNSIDKLLFILISSFLLISNSYLPHCFKTCFSAKYLIVSSDISLFAMTFV